MAWYSYTFARALPPEQATNTASGRELLMAAPESQPVVHTRSRQGVLLGSLKKVTEFAALSCDLYLLKDQAVLLGAEIEQQHTCINDLLAQIDRDPQLVLEATKEPCAPQGTIHLNGFEPLPYQLVYSPGCTIKDGWVYFYSEERVRSLLVSAPCGSDPTPAGDDEGETLEYVFGFLKSHASLLQTASESQLAVAYAEMNI